MGKNRSVISLFTGAGGLDFGLEHAGFETRVAVEMDNWCCQTIRANRKWPLLENRLENVSTEEILQAAGLKKKEPDLVAGGPPCQPFSKSGYWVNGDTARLDDPRSNTLAQYMRVLEETLPKAFLLENVFGLAYEGKDEGLKYLETRLKEINRKNKTNYSFTWKVLNSADYGVPQIRERVFIIGARDGLEFKFPVQRYRDPSENADLLSFGLPPYRTAWDALGDLIDPAEDPSSSKVGGKWGDLLPTIPPGENYLWHSERGGGSPLFRWRSRYWSFLLKLHPRKPSWTIQAQPGTAIGPFHWNNRRLTMREMARIQTFPDDVEICGGISHVQRQLGNAVPSALAELLGLEIRKQLLGDRLAAKTPGLIPSVRPRVPEAQYVKRLPKKYAFLSRLEPERHARRDPISAAL